MTSDASESTAVRLRPRTRARMVWNVAPSKVGSGNPNELAHLPRHCAVGATPRIAQRSNMARSLVNRGMRSGRSTRMERARRPQGRPGGLARCRGYAANRTAARAPATRQ